MSIGRRENEPPVSVCQNILVSADGRCQAAVLPAAVDNDSYDPDQDPIMLILDPPGPYPLGAVQVTLTVQDDPGLSNSYAATITVMDDTPPEITCPADVTLECPADTSFAANGSAQTSKTQPASNASSPAH